MQAVDPAFAGFDAVRGIVLDAAFGIVDIFADQVDTAVFIQHLRRTEPHAGHVDTHRALHAAASRRLHAAPVLERIAHQQVGRQRNDRIVEIADFHRRERHLDHRTVGPVFGNRNPVPTLSMSLAESWMPETNPRMLSRKISMMIAADAPKPANRLAGDLSIRIETISMPQISAAMPCPVCLSPLIGLFCHAGRAEAIGKPQRARH